MSKTIALSDDAYLALAAMKRPDESFTDVVRRMAARPSLMSLAGILSPESGERLEAAIRDNRKRRMAIRRKKLGL